MEGLSSEMIKRYAKNVENVAWNYPRPYCIMEQLSLFGDFVGTAWRVWRRWPNCDICNSAKVIRVSDDSIAGVEWGCEDCGASWIQHRIAGKIL